MAFIATNEAAVTVYPSIKELARNVHSIASKSATVIQSDIDAEQLLYLMRVLKRLIDQLDALSVTAGIAAYAQDQEGDPSYDVIAEFNAMKNAMTSVGTWIANNLPKDGNGYLLLWTLSGTTPVPRTFTPAQLTGLGTELQTLIDAIAV